jgi:hypothetical protein
LIFKRNLFFLFFFSNMIFNFQLIEFLVNLIF